MSGKIGYRSLTRSERREVRQYAKQGSHHPDPWIAAVCWRWASSTLAQRLSKGYVVEEVIGGLAAPGSSIIGRELLDRGLARRLLVIGQPSVLLPEEDDDE
jgi:hypothetical protein